MYSWHPRSFLKLITLTSLMAIISRLQANQCVGRAYQHIYVGGPPLPSDEILSSHNVGRSAAAGPAKCFSLCKKEPKCVGFNVRSRINDENCQLTNVTTSKNKNKPKEGEWTLFRDLEATKREEEGKKNKECETSPAAKSSSIVSESRSVVLSPSFTTSAGKRYIGKTLKKSSSAFGSVNNEPYKDIGIDLGVEKTTSDAPSSSLIIPMSSPIGDPMSSQEKASSIQITKDLGHLDQRQKIEDLGHNKEKTPLRLASSGVMTVVSSPVGDPMSSHEKTSSIQPTPTVMKTTSSSSEDLEYNKKGTPSVAPSSSLMTLISSPVGDPISSHEKTSSIQPTPTAISFNEYPDLNKTSSDEPSTSIVSQMSTTVDALVTAVGKTSPVVPPSEHVAASSTNIQPSSVSKCKPFSTSIQPLSSNTSGVWLDVGHACIGAKGNSYQEMTYTAPSSCVGAARLVHTSGYVANAGSHNGSFWGAHSDHSLSILITDSQNRILYPSPSVTKVSGNGWYTLPGYTGVSPKLVFSDFRTPQYFEKGRKFRVWYGEDWSGFSEQDNHGKSCMQVYFYLLGR